MDKRYQVFVSSTYSDLKEERGKVMQTIIALDCIPAGMEWFPAIDEDQFEFIKKIIDDCDYYVLIVGGRYGSISEDGISYTEKEYDYAVSKNIPVIAFLHNDIKKLAFDKSEINPECIIKLETFREKVAKGRLVQFWNNADELNGKVAISLTKTIKKHPAVGWVKANMQTNVESLQEINNLRKRIECLEEENVKLRDLSESRSNIEDIASLDEKIIVRGKSYNVFWNLEVTWERLFALIAPLFLGYHTDYESKQLIGKILSVEAGSDSLFADVNEQDFQTIKIQFSALGLISIEPKKTVKGEALCWHLTNKGADYMTKLRVVRTEKK